ncbi:hypothetical protein [Aquamicrobium sp.]|nr:hypothetical protein [Aquamicrobium sp.]
MDPIVVPIPIRPDLVVKVQMPIDISRQEAERVARVVAALAGVKR